MPLPLNLQRQLSRFKRLPQVDDVWEGAVLPMPAWVDDGPDGLPYRPMAAIWVSTTRRLAHFGDMTAGHAREHTPLVAVLEMATSSKLAGFRPRMLRVNDAQIAAALRAALTDVTIEIVDEVPAVRAFITEMADSLTQEQRLPPALTAPGVTVDRLRGFADAARQWFDAAPWWHLNDGDLLEIAAPKAGKGLRYFGVMGSAGQEFGIGFFASVRQYEDVVAGRSPDDIFDGGSEWAVYFSPGWEIPAADLDAWDRFGLPLASARAYPCAMRLSAQREPQRPDAGRLAFLEGLLRAVAATSEREMDAGRWSHTVSTAEGEQTYTLMLPDILHPETARRVPDRRSMERMAAEIARTLGGRDIKSIEDANEILQARFAGRSDRDMTSTAATPLERAQDLIYDAFEARGRRQLQLIRHALAISPDCADAYLLLAERAVKVDETKALLEKAVAAGERALGPDAFDDPNRSFWHDVPTRPYMRARAALGEHVFYEEDAFDAAAGHFAALLRLNPDDNQGLRYRLLTTLLQANRNDEADTLIAEHGEQSAMWLYSSVLLALRAKDKKLAKRRLRSALKANRRVPAYLTGRRELPPELPSSYVPGSDDEAVLCADDLLEAWSGTPDAVRWLRVESQHAR